jgi:hypothetical protein
MDMPLLAKVQVIAHLPQRQQMMVQLISQANIPGIPIFIGFNNAADALRVSQKPLPGIGTWGLAAFPSGDPRNGIWLRSYYPSMLDAIHTTGDATDPFIDYDAHFSGNWHLLDGKGNYAQQFADGSYATFGSGAILPTIYRHIVENNQQQQQALTFAQRVATPPPPFQGSFVQAGSGLTVRLDSSGNFLVSGGAMASISLVFGQSSLKIDSSGNATLALAGADKFNITQGGGAPNDFLVLASKLVAAYNAHTHPTPSGESSPPSAPITGAGVGSTIIDISN